VRARATLVNRVPKALADANLKLASGATDIRGVWGRAILAALLAGETHPALLAELAKGPLRQKRPQLEQALRCAATCVPTSASC
jgi:transposase